LLDRLRSFPYASQRRAEPWLGSKYTRAEQVCACSRLFFAGERRSSPGLEWDEDVREVARCGTSPDFRETPHLTEDGRALPIMGRAFRRAVDCGSRGDPSALPTSEIESLREALALRKFEPHPYLVAGNKVRINSGSLVGMVGVLVRKKNTFRVCAHLGRDHAQRRCRSWQRRDRARQTTATHRTFRYTA